MSASSVLPVSARFALWFTAWAQGRTSLDDARDAVVADDAAHDVAGLPDTGDDAGDLVPLIVALGRLRVEGATEAALALPVPGDPLGVAGPADFNAAALEEGEGVVLPGAALGLVPVRAGAGVVWQAYPAEPRRQLPDPAEADRSLRHTVLEVAEALAALDVARWRPEVSDELMALRDRTELPLPPETGSRAVRLAGLSLRCRTIVSLALDDDGGAVSAAEAERRRTALLPLDHAARRGLVAACSAHTGR